MVTDAMLKQDVPVYQDKWQRQWTSCFVHAEGKPWLLLFSLCLRNSNGVRLQKQSLLHYLSSCLIITLAVELVLFFTSISNDPNHLLYVFLLSSHFLFNSNSCCRSDMSVNQSCLLTEEREMTWEIFQIYFRGGLLWLQSSISACTSDLLYTA